MSKDENTNDPTIDDNPIEQIIEEVVVKKRGRGRPRKNKSQPELPKKKRGRKPKEIHNIELNDIDKNTINSEQEIVLHLPISKEDIQKFKKNKSTNNDKTIKTCSATTTEKSNSSPSKEPDTNIFTITDMTYDISSSDSDSDTKEEIIKKLKKENEKLKKEIDDLKKDKNYTNNAIITNKATKIGSDLIDIKTGEIIQYAKTDKACYWCTEQFDNLPSFLIMKYKDGKYYALSIPFCSDNCKCACSWYEFGGYDKSNRHSINVKYRKQSTGIDEDIALAPARLALDKFTGPKTLEQFRENSLINDIKCRIVIPPMKAIVPILEETTIDEDSNTYKSTDNSLVLKRSKPLPQASNTLLKTFETLKKTVR